MITPRNIAFGAVVVLLLLSLPGVTLLPVGPFLGLDIQELHAYHACAARDNPYLATGAECGDALDRPLIYPPPMYFLFWWTRFVTFTEAFLIWSAVIVIGLLLSLSAWVPRGHHGARVAVFLVLLFLQLPVLYSLERGNNDVVIVIGWTIAALLFASGRFGASGFTGGVMVALKLYPAATAVVVGVGLIAEAIRRTDARMPLVRFTLGGIVAVVLSVLIFLEPTISFLSEEFALAMTYEPQLDLVSHTLGAIAPGGIGLILSLPLLAMWSVASVRSLRSDVMLVFAGGLAISTYFSGLSNDYNLITTYPLLLLLFVRATSVQPGRLALGLLLLGLVAIVGNRQWFDGGDELAVLHTGLQWLWLMVTGAAVAFVPERLRITSPSTVSEVSGASAPTPVRPTA